LGEERQPPSGLELPRLMPFGAAGIFLRGSRGAVRSGGPFRIFSCLQSLSGIRFMTSELLDQLREVTSRVSELRGYL